MVFFGHENFYSENINSVHLNACDESCIWLVDTGASLSAIRHELLHKWNVPVHIERIRINGIEDIYFAMVLFA